MYICGIFFFKQSESNLRSFGTTTSRVYKQVYLDRTRIISLVTRFKQTVNVQCVYACVWYVCARVFVGTEPQAQITKVMINISAWIGKEKGVATAINDVYPNERQEHGHTFPKI